MSIFALAFLVLGSVSSVVPVPGKTASQVWVANNFIDKSGDAWVNTTNKVASALQPIATNDMATMTWVNDKEYVTKSVTNGILVKAEQYADQYANQAPDYTTVSNKAMTALQEHQSLQPATNYTDSVASRKQDKITDFTTTNAVKDLIKEFTPTVEYATDTNSVHKTDPSWISTSNLAATAIQQHQSLAWSNDYRRINAYINWEDITNHEDFVTETVTNGLATQEWVIQKKYVTQSITNGLASQDWVESKEYVTKVVTNGILIAANSYTDEATNALNKAITKAIVIKQDRLPYPTNAIPASVIVDLPSSTDTNSVKALINSEVGGTNAVKEVIKDMPNKATVTQVLIVSNRVSTIEGKEAVWNAKLDASATNGFVKAAVTNGLASETWTLSKQYVTKEITNGLASVKWVDSQGFVTKVITNGILSAAKDYTNQFTNQAPNYAVISNLAVTAIQDHQSLAPATNYTDSVASKKQDRLFDYTTTNAVKNLIKEYAPIVEYATDTNAVHKTDDAWKVTTNLAATALQEHQSLEPATNYANFVVAATTNLPPVYAVVSNKAMSALQEHQSLAWSNDYRRIDAKINWTDVTNHADFVTQSITNGLASESWVESKEYVTKTITNGFVKAAITNGFATEQWVLGHGYTTTNDVCSIVTNDVGDTWMTGKHTPPEYLPQYAITNSAVRWNANDSHWEIYVEGVADGQSIDGWYVGYVYDFGAVSPFEIVNTDYNSSTVTVGKVNFSSDVGRCIYANRAKRNVLGLAYERDLPKDYTSTNATCNLITNNVAEWALHGKTAPVTDLAPATNYTDKIAQEIRGEIPDVSQFVTKAVTNGLASETWVTTKEYVTKSVTNGLASVTWVDSQGFVTESITNGILDKAKIYTNQFTNQAPSYASVSNKAMTALQEHQSLQPATNYTDIVVSKKQDKIPDFTTTNAVKDLIKEFTPEVKYATDTNAVHKADPSWISTSNLAASALQEHQSLAFTNDFRKLTDRINWADVTNHDDFVTKAITNGLASTLWVLTQNYVDKNVTNGILVKAEQYADQYANQAPDYGTVSNKAMTALQEHQSLAWSNDYRRITAKIDWNDVTNHEAFVTKSVTNGLVSQEWVENKGYVTEVITNGILDAAKVYTDKEVSDKATTNQIKALDKRILDIENKESSWNDKLDKSATNGFVKASITNGLAAQQWVLNKKYVTESITNDILTKAEQYADQYANQAPDYDVVSNKAMTAIQEHQSLEPATNYTDKVAQEIRGEIPDVSQFVTKSVTNGLLSVDTASKTYQVKGDYLTPKATNDTLKAANKYTDEQIIAIGAVTPQGVTNIVTGFNYVTKTITNGLESVKHAADTYQVKGNYVTEAITNGLASQDWVLNKKYVDKSVTNNLASVKWVEDQGYVTKEITNGYVKASITNGFASQQWVLDKSYVTETITNGILVKAETYADQYANQAPDYNTVSNKAMSAIQEHQSLQPATNYTDSVANKKQDKISDYTSTNAVKNLIKEFAPKAEYATDTNAVHTADNAWITTTNLATTALQEHQSLAWSNDYRRITAKINWEDVTNHEDFVTKTITNELASEKWVLNKGYVTEAVTNGIATQIWVTNQNYVTETITNGLVSQNWVISKEYVTKSVTNGILSAAKDYTNQFTNQAPNYAVISNLAITALQKHQSLTSSTNYTDTATNAVLIIANNYADQYASQAPDYGTVSNKAMTALQEHQSLESATNYTDKVAQEIREEIPDVSQFVTKSVTNGLASENWVLGKKYVTEVITNGLLSVDSAANTYQVKGNYLTSEATNETLKAANKYTDEQIIAVGAVTPQVVTNIVTGFNYATKDVTNGLESAEHAADTYQVKGNYVTEIITNGLASEKWVTSKKYVTASITNGLLAANAAANTYQVKGDYLTPTATNGFVTASVTNGILTKAEQYADQYANQAPDYTTVSNKAMTALQEHQSLEPATNYTDKIAQEIRGEIPDVSQFVTKEITNNLASTAWVTSQGYVTKAITNGLLKSSVAADTYQVKGNYLTPTATNGFVTASITNGILTKAETYADQYANQAPDYNTVSNKAMNVLSQNTWLVDGDAVTVNADASLAITNITAAQTSKLAGIAMNATSNDFSALNSLLSKEALTKTNTLSDVRTRLNEILAALKELKGNN